jgi:hypothetical protein
VVIMIDEVPLGAVADEAPPSAAGAAVSAALAESGGLVGDPEALRRRFAEDGYLFLRGALDRGSVLAARSRILAGFHRQGWLGRPDSAVPAEGFGTHLGRKDFWPGIVEMLRVREMHALAFDPTLRGVLGALYGREFFAHPRRLPRIKFPAANDDWSETFAHQDFPYIQGSLDTVTVWMPLGDCSRTDGSLEVLAGSHLSGAYPLITGPRFPCTAATVGNEDERWRGADYAAGDVVLFSSLTVHRARPNHGETVRISVDCRFQPTCEPVCRSAMEPGFTPDVPPWSQLLESPQDAWLYEVPEHLDLVRFRPPSRRTPLPESNTCFPWLRESRMF